MLSIEPANGAFFADPAKPAAQPPPEPSTPEAPAIPSATHDAAAVASAAMIDVPLGTLIFRAGLLGEEQLEDALREGMRTGRRLGEVLIERGWIQERELGRLLAGQKGLPFVEVSASDVEPAALELLSEVNAKLQIALPLRHEDGRLVVAVADPSNELMLENLRRTLGAPPKIVVAPHAELVKAIVEAYEAARPQAAPEPETVAEPEAEAQPEPQAQAERAPARPLPIVRRPKELAPEPSPAPARLPSPPMLRAPVAPPPVEETPEVEAPAAQPAPDATPEPEPQAAEVQPALEPQATEVEPAPEPELILELPPDWPPAGEEPAEQPAGPVQPAEQPAPEPPAQEEPASPTAVILRLRDGATLEVGTFPTVAEAANEAQEVVIEIAAADRNSTWPFFAQRYLRPDLIISVDLIEQSSDSDGLRRSQR